MATSGSQRSSNRSNSSRSTNRSSTNRNSTNRRNSSGSQNSNNNYSKRQEVDAKIQQEAVALIVFFVVVMIFLCMINVIKGAFGPAVKSFMLGSFGILGYLIPVAIFIGICFKISNADNQIATLKLVSALVFIFMIGILLCYITGVDISYLSQTSDTTKQLYELQGGGGVIFGLAACWLFKIFGQAGSIFLAIVLGIVCLVVITERSFLDQIRNGSYKPSIKLIDIRRDLTEVEDEYEDDKHLPAIIDDPADEYENANFLPVRRRSNPRARQNVPDPKVEELRRIRDTHRELKRQRAEQREDERIAKPVPKQEPLDNITVGKNKPSGNDDIHEITVLPPVPSEDEEIVQASMMKEIIVHNDGDDVSDKNITDKPHPKEEIFEINILKDPVDDADDTDDIPEVTLNDIEVSNDIEISNESDVPGISAAQKPSADSADIETVLTAPDLTQMPQPITERTHASNEQIAATDNSTMPNETPVTKPRKYEKPKISLLKKSENKRTGDSDQQLKETALLLQQTLKTFGVAVTVTDISQGPSVTRYELQLGEGIKVNKIVNLADDIKLNLAAEDIRIEAPIPGKAAVGIELPNKTTSEVLIRSLLESSEYKNAASNLSFAVGKDITGKTIVADIAKMPHMLVAGATGSGKSVCINTLIMSILYKAHPDDVKMIMIDPKVVELSVYNGIPHLLIPVVTDPRKANAALQWAVNEMSNRYKAFAAFGLRDLKGFNQRVEQMRDRGEQDVPEKMPQIVVIVDELADLMMVASKEVEESICRLAQLARAAGIHLIIATQRPSVDVITGLIKANMPSRVAFKVTSGVDSRTILDMVGAEKLLGKGDMLFYPQGYSKPLRVQGAFVSDQEVEDVVSFLKKNAGDQYYDPSVDQQITGMSEPDTSQESSPGKGGSGADNSLDAYFDDACRFVVEKEKASSGMLQRVFKVGYTRAARIIDQMEAAGVVGPEEGTKPRKVLMTSIQLEEFLKQKNQS